MRLEGNRTSVMLLYGAAASSCSRLNLPRSTCRQHQLQTHQRISSFVTRKTTAIWRTVQVGRSVGSNQVHPLAADGSFLSFGERFANAWSSY